MALGGEWPLWRTAAVAITSNWLIVSIAVLVIVSSNEDSPIQNPNEKWQFKCPNVGDVAQYKKVVVTWTLNNAILLKIDHGNLTVVSRLTTFTKQDSVGPGNIYTILANDARYVFSYNEFKGDFYMSIEKGKLEDVGTWACHVTLYQKDNKVEELSVEETYNLESENGITKWPYWNIETLPDGDGKEDADDINNGMDNDKPLQTIVFDDESSFNSTASFHMKFSYMVPLLITIPTVIF